MLGPHYQKIAQVEHRLNTRQVLQRIQTRSQSNPLTQVIQKLKKQFSEYQTAYDDSIIDHQINSVDRILSFDGKLGPILSGLQKQNNLLRKQLSVLETQLSNTVSICQQILTENNSLKQIIKNKNMDLEKLIETIALNQSEQRSNLQQKIGLLEQQNNILIRHLQQVKKEHETYSERFSIQRKQISIWKQRFEQVKRQLQQKLQQEQQLSRRLALMQHNLYSERQKLYNLQQEYQNIKFQNNQIKNQILVYKNEQMANNIEVIKTRLEEQYAGIVEEHRSLKKERIELIREAQTSKIQKDECLQRLNNQDRLLSKLRNDFELTQNLLNEQKQKNSTLQSAIGKLQQKYDDLRQEHTKLKLENESITNYSINKEKMLQREIQELRKELQSKSIEMETRFREIKEKTRVLMQAKEGEMKSLNDTNIELRRLLERQRQKYTG